MEHDDIYSDLGSHDWETKVSKLEVEKASLLECIEGLQNDIQRLCNELIEMKKTTSNLKRNISELYKTAKCEIERKNRIITQLQQQIADGNRVNYHKQERRFDSGPRINHNEHKPFNGNVHRNKSDRHEISVQKERIMHSEDAKREDVMRTVRHEGDIRRNRYEETGRNRLKENYQKIDERRGRSGSRSHTNRNLHRRERRSRSRSRNSRNGNGVQKRKRSISRSPNRSKKDSRKEEKIDLVCIDEYHSEDKELNSFICIDDISNEGQSYDFKRNSDLRRTLDKRRK